MFINTSRFHEFTRKRLQQLRLHALNHLDARRFARTAAFSLYDDQYSQLESRIIYNVHALEKGLSRRHNQRLGFGIKALKNLNDALVVYMQKGYHRDNFAFVQGCAILQRYKSYHESKDYDVSFLNNIVNPEFLENDIHDTKAGFQVVNRADKLDNYQKNFTELITNRVSVRDFAQTTVDIDKVMAVLDLAKKTPSVCNRQGWHVILVKDQKTIAKLLKIQHGFGGYDLPQYVLAMMVSNNTFLSPVERNEAYVDGGLFSMSVLLGLEAASLAAVPLNAMMNSKQEREMRSLLGAGDDLTFIMFIAVGNLPKQAVSPVSERKPAKEFTSVI